MSPTSRRGRAVPASQHKSPARGASAASRKPVAAVEEMDDQPDDLNPKAKAKVKGNAAAVAPVRRQRGLNRLKKTSGYKYANEAFGAYLPLFLAFVVVFAGLWGWISFGPHTPTAKENWVAAENKWLQKREDDRQKTINDVAVFATQQADYKAFEADTKGWMDDLRKFSTADWDGAKPSLGATQQSYNSGLVTAFITAGDTEVVTLGYIATAKTPDDAVILGNAIISQEQDFDAAYAAARSQIMGVDATASGKPTLVLPSVCPGVNPLDASSPSDSPSASPTASPSPSPSPTASASPSRPSSANPLAGSSLSVPSPSAAAASLDACASAAASASAEAAASASPSPSPSPSPSLTPSPSPSMSAKP